MPSLEIPERFTWRDGERLTLFGAGVLADAPRLLSERDFGRYELLTTRRALESAPSALAEEAAAVHEVAPGPVPDVAAELIGAIRGERLVALGGGRVIDSAKAVAAVHGLAVAALPTTLSGAELTTIHRLPAGHRAERLIRPSLVLADPIAMTALDEERLRASAMNALAHGADSLYTPGANPVSRMVALRGAELIAAALAADRAARDAAALALGSLLCAHALDSAGFGLHHVVCQTLVRVLGTPHAETNATFLPRALEAMRPRAPDGLAPLAAALGCAPDEVAARVESLAGGRRGLGKLGAERSRLDEALDAMLARPELGHTPRPPERAELRELVEAAW